MNLQTFPPTQVRTSFSHFPRGMNLQTFPLHRFVQAAFFPIGAMHSQIFPLHWFVPAFLSPVGERTYRPFPYTDSYQPFSRRGTNLRPFPYMVFTGLFFSRRGTNLQTFLLHGSYQLSSLPSGNEFTDLLPTRVRTFAPLPSTPSLTVPPPPPPPSVLVPYGSFGDKASLLLIRMLLLSPQFITNVLIVWVQREGWAEEGSVLRA